MDYKEILKELCRRYGVGCIEDFEFNGDEKEKFAQFLIAYLETFYLLSDSGSTIHDCVNAIQCLEKLLDTIRTATRLAIEGKYRANIDVEKMGTVIVQLRQIDRTEEIP